MPHPQRDRACHDVQLQVAPAGFLQRPATGRTDRGESVDRQLQLFLQPPARSLPAPSQDRLFDFAQRVHRRV